MIYLNFRRLEEKDSEELCNLLLDSNNEYSPYFSPFPFEKNIISKFIAKAQKDQFYGIEACNTEVTIIGFYMLRGLDEGYESPMFGIFIAEKYSSIGIAKLALCHAEIFCRLNGMTDLLLKVNTNNKRAFKFYLNSGFDCIRYLTSHDILMKKNINNIMKD